MSKSSRVLIIIQKMNVLQNPKQSRSSPLRTCFLVLIQHPQRDLVPVKLLKYLGLTRQRSRCSLTKSCIHRPLRELACKSYSSIYSLSSSTCKLHLRTSKRRFEEAGLDWPGNMEISCTEQCSRLAACDLYSSSPIQFISAAASYLPPSYWILLRCERKH